MAWTQDQLDALEEAIAMGALTVKYKDKEITYRSMSDMMGLRDRMRISLGLAKVASNRIPMVTTKGLP